ncbi:MAG: SWIM zinc finger family protein [Cyanobacteria bacterium P01_D01_bin.44]
MLLKSHLVYSAAAVRRILGLPHHWPVKVEAFADAVWVWIKGRRPTFWPKQAFKQHFCHWRQRRAQAVEITEIRPSHFAARSVGQTTGSRESIYFLDARAEGIFCTCEDFHRQLSAWNRGCCKHCYAVLAHLGFNSLGEYLALQDQDGWVA